MSTGQRSLLGSVKATDVAAAPAPSLANVTASDPAAVAAEPVNDALLQVTGGGYEGRATPARGRGGVGGQLPRYTLASASPMGVS